MNIESVKTVYFSPTGTTKAVAHAIASGIDSSSVNFIDITKPAARKVPLETSDNDLLLVAFPVYMGRIPALLANWLNALRADNTPVVCIVVYGNRVYDNALLELKDMMTKSGGVPIAFAAYIGEHSFSSSRLPTAEGRPDLKDLNHAKLFGRKINKKLTSAASVSCLPLVKIPGNYPYGGVTNLWSVDFIAVSNDCVQCGICTETCPVGAIDSEKSYIIDIEKCITCCACIKNCPKHARTMKAGPVKDAAKRLSKMYKDRKEPEIYF